MLQLYLYLPFNADFHSNPFLLSMIQIEAGTAPRQPAYERLSTNTVQDTHGTPFIRICAPIYNGVSPCSNFTHQKLTTSTTNISRTEEKSSRASTHLRIDAICHQTGVLRGPGHSDRMARGRAKHINSANCSLPGVPRTVMRDRRDPRPVAGAWPRGSVQGSGPCRARCVNEVASGPRSLAGRGLDPMEGHDLDNGWSLWVVAPPFSRGL